MSTTMQHTLMLLTTVVAWCHAAPAADEIKRLPGFASALPSKHYSVSAEKGYRFLPCTGYVFSLANPA